MKLNVISLLILILIVTLAAAPAEAEPQFIQPPTPFPTPTPNEQGQIIFTVQEGDSLWRIAAIAEMSVEEVMALNGIQQGDFLSPGMELFLGSISPTLSPELRVTPSPEPSPTPLFGTGEICVMLFLDENGNARMEEDEGLLAEGQISVIDRSGALLGDHTTDEDPEGHCFLELEDGDYNVSAAVPPDYNPTTSMNAPVRLKPGDVHHVQFGAQPSAALRGLEGEQDGDQSTLLGIAGAVLLAVAGVLGYYAMQYSRRKPTLGR